MAHEPTYHPSIITIVHDESLLSINQAALVIITSWAIITNHRYSITLPQNKIDDERTTYQRRYLAAQHCSPLSSGAGRAGSCKLGPLIPSWAQNHMSQQWVHFQPSETTIVDKLSCQCLYEWVMDKPPTNKTNEWGRGGGRCLWPIIETCRVATH